MALRGIYNTSFEKMVDKEKKNKLGFGVNDCPIAVYKQFKSGCVDRCGDVHWVRIKELLDIEESYVTLSRAVYGEQEVAYEQNESIKEDDVQREEPKYLGRGR